LFAALATSLLRFAARFLLIFLLLLALWPFVSGLYARATAAAGGTVLRAVSLLPTGSHLEARDRRVWIFRPVTKVDGSRGMAGVNVLDDATFFNSLLLASLIVATPSLGWASRLKALCLGGALLWFTHLADLYVKLKWIAIYPGLRQHGVVPDPASPATLTIFEWLYAFFSLLGFGLFPILIWIAVVGLWWPFDGARDRPREEDAPERIPPTDDPAAPHLRTDSIGGSASRFDP
jgi:hypothetical protein